MKYRVIRFYYNKPGRHRVIYSGLTLEQAQEHCSNPETSSKTCKTSQAKAITRRNGPWFDGYEEDK